MALVAFLTVAAKKESSPPTITLDVKDAKARVVLKDVQKQCRIENLIIDPDVTGSGTFYMKKVPCKTAFPIILRTLGLKATTYSSNVITVEAAQP